MDSLLKLIKGHLAGVGHNSLLYHLAATGLVLSGVTFWTELALTLIVALQLGQAAHRLLSDYVDLHFVFAAM
jgi:hypothetical protein